jgi:putative Ca2+/H+ antiporter (TMEM165/GDT1 family)
MNGITKHAHHSTLPRSSSFDDRSWWQGMAACFLALFLTEWGDPSQIAVAALSVKFHDFLAPWLGGTLAMAMKGALAIFIGLKLRDRLPQKSLRIIATASFLLLGTLSLRSVVSP